MAQHICDNCGATVGDEEFCPTCGAWLDPLQGGGGESEEFEEFALGEAPTGADPGRQVRQPQRELPCPSCGTLNPASNRHCEECGARLSQGNLPVAPRPAVQTTAGVRAAIGISAVLVMVILAVLLVNIFGGEETATETTIPPSETTTSTRRVSELLAPLSVSCSVTGISGLDCDNLIDGDPTTEYQFNWLERDTATDPTITMTFDKRVVVRQILWSNISDQTRFLQNYRVARMSISDDDGFPQPIELDNEPGQQEIPYTSFETFRIEIVLTGVHEAQPVEDELYEELAIADIQVFGFAADEAPAPDTSTQETTTETTTETTGG